MLPFGRPLMSMGWKSALDPFFSIKSRISFAPLRQVKGLSGDLNYWNPKGCRLLVLTQWIGPSWKSIDHCKHEDMEQ